MFTRPAIDVSDEGEKYKVEADLPGVPKENVEVRIGDNGRSITIEGKVVEKEESHANKSSAKTGASGTDSKAVVKPDESSTTQISTERPFTRNVSFTRTVWLPKPVDTKHVSAKMEHGVLTITVNKTHDKASTVVAID
ncbi:Heat shock protein 16 [Psilocybe cubensis]|nr:Heat shock protein 16 [Psilocybe cubensis]KAH9480527.1 Heat shock protein 16 [Psilocybe cubensis]